MTQGVGNWTFNVLPGQAGRRSEKQSPWYDMATAAVAMIARPYKIGRASCRERV